MHRMFYLLIFLQLGIFQALGITTSRCDQKDVSITLLNMAVNMINEAKTFVSTNRDLQNNFPPKNGSRPIDCEEVLCSGRNESGVYNIWPRNRILEEGPLEVYCDMDTDGGGWTVIQRRGNFGNPKDYFRKDWNDYKVGFGNIKQDFWLGNDNIYALSNQRLSSIRFDLMAVDGVRKYAQYDEFWIDDERDKYRLRIDGYSGNAGDSMIKEHNNQKFTTQDQKNDIHVINCAIEFKGAWWYEKCHQANLNGMYYRGVHASSADGVNWFTFRGYREAMDTTEMKIRPKNFKKTCT